MWKSQVEQRHTGKVSSPSRGRARIAVGLSSHSEVQGHPSPLSSHVVNPLTTGRVAGPAGAYL